LPNAKLARQRREIATLLLRSGDCDGLYSAILTSNNWRTSLVPAPAVIPAPIAYIKVAAVKGFVVEYGAHGDLGSSRVFPDSV
jgi:hypothetical protein